MNFFTKTRLLIGAIILLAAINIAILATVGFHFIRMRSNLQQEPPSEMRHTRFIADELKLTPEQQEDFIKLREEFLYDIQNVKSSIRETYKESMIELSKETPDDQILDSLSNEIANLHRLHHEVTINHFRKVKGICNADQNDCLKRMFFRMMPMDEFQHRRSQNMHAPRNFRENRERFRKNNN